MPIQIKNVLLLDNVDPSAKTILESRGINATLQKEKLTKDNLVQELQKYDGVVVRSATTVTSEIIQQCPNLKIIGRAGTGVDNVDIDSATKNGVIVMNTPGGNTLSAAEHTCTLIACLSRNVPAADASMKAGKWDRKAFMGNELYEKTLGIVGLGRIGREAATRMQSFGMKTIGFDPLVSKEEAAKFDIEWMECSEIWPRADYITVHTPLIPQTKGLLNDDSFAKCKKGVKVINCARGGIIDEGALLRALESGQCGGAGLDVFVEEPPTNLSLVKHPKVVACPHLGASTKEAQSRCGREIADQIADVSEGKSFFGVLNAPALSQGASDEMKEWIPAMVCAGKFLKAFMNSNPSTVTLDSYGNVLSKAGHCLKAAFCSGFLQCTTNVNLVNAAPLLAAKGTQITLGKNPDSKESACMIAVKSETCTMNFFVSVISKTPVLISMDGAKFSVPVILKGNLLVFKSSNNNLSTAIGQISNNGATVTSLSTTDAQNNLQWFAVGVNQQISDAVLQSLNAVSIQF
uniref:D-3-phosphoglycerate dehydrogenase n=1 Tax=Phallusia mammillata TaxID=59560 RepID=A0A6F9DN29_9ASCI|nr:D-3-phosphoglycerate dehydrogenase [Phallusia mammillata]